MSTERLKEEQRYVVRYYNWLVGKDQLDLNDMSRWEEFLIESHRNGEL